MGKQLEFQARWKTGKIKLDTGYVFSMGGEKKYIMF